MGSVINYQEAHGPVATFETDVVEKIKKIEASIEPIQDLNGYDSPWPAGGGKNLLQVTASTTTVNGVTYTIENDGTIKLSGTASARSVFKIAENFTLKAGTYKLNGSQQTIPLSCYLNFNGGGVTVSETANVFDVSFTLTEDVTTDYVRFDIASGTNTNGLVFKPMIRLSSISDATYAPYSNICPITGWTEVNVSRTGKNLFSSEIGRYIWASGVRYINGTGKYCASTDKIPIKGGESYVVSFSNTAQTDAVYFSWFSGNEFIGLSSVYYSPYTADAPANADSVCVNFRNQEDYTGDPTVSNVMIEAGSTPSAYEPYQGETYDIAFPSEAGTVYGGTLDAVNGVLTVDRGSISVTDYLTKIGNNGIRNGNQLIALSVTGKKAGISNFISNLFVVGSSGVGKYTMHGREASATVEFEIPLSALGVTEEDPFDVRLSASRQWFTDKPTQLVYELATPVTYQLTPLEIQTIIGTNNIYTTTGNTSVLYPKTITPVETMSNISLMELRRNIIAAQANDNLYDKWIWRQDKNDFIVRNNTAGFLEGVGNNIYLDQRENAENNRLNVSTKRGKVPLVLYNSTEGGSSTPIKLYPIPIPTNANNIHISSDVEDGEYGAVVVRLVNGAYKQMKLNPSWIKNPKIYFVTGKNHYLVPYIRRADNADFITMPQNVQLTFSHDGQWRWTLTEENFVLWKRNSYWDNTNSKICFYSSTNVNNYLTVCVPDGFCGYWYFDQPESMHNHAPIPIPPTATKVTVTTTPSLQAHLILLKCFDNQTQQFIRDNGWKSTPVTMTFNADDNLELAITLRVNSAVNDFTGSTTPTEIIVQFE